MSLKRRAGFILATPLNRHWWPANVQKMPGANARRKSGNCQILAVSQTVRPSEVFQGVLERRHRPKVSLSGIHCGLQGSDREPNDSTAGYISALQPASQGVGAPVCIAHDINQGLTSDA